MGALPLPDQKPFRKAKLRTDAKAYGKTANVVLLALLVVATGALEIVPANPGAILNQLGETVDRCRIYLARLLTDLLVQSEDG